MRLFYSLQAVLFAVIGAMFHTPFDVTSVGTPPTLTGMGAAALKRVMYDNKLNEPITTLDDPWVRGQLTNVVKMDGSKMRVPRDVFFQMPSTNDNTLRCQAILPLQEAPQEGDGESMPGNEEGIRLQYCNFYYNQMMKAVKSQGWGVHYEDTKLTGAHKMLDPMIKRLWMEYRGVRIRKASMLTIEDALTKSPVSLVQNLCSNIFICNLDYNDMPVWDLTAPTVTAGAVDSLGYYSSKTFGGGATTYIEAVCDKMVEASGTSATPVAYMTIDDLDRLWVYLTQVVKMPKGKIGENLGYLVMLPQNVYDDITSLNNSNGFKDYFQAVHNTTADDISYLGIMHRYKDMYFACDPRGPTLTLSGANGSWTLQPGFYYPGDYDARNNAAWSILSGSVNYVYDAFFVYGAGALAERVVIPTKFVNEVQAYGYLKGRGSYNLSGIATPQWDVDSPDDANDSNGTGAGKTLIQRSLVMGICSRKTVGGSLRATG